MTQDQSRQVADRINATYGGGYRDNVVAVPSVTTMGVHGVVVMHRLPSVYGHMMPAMDAYTTIAEAYNVWPWKCDGIINRDGGN